MQSPVSKRPNSRETILNAAEEIVVEAGAAHLTLDAVAERAGVSKGGLLYNYATKEALLQAMVARHIEHMAHVEQEIFDTLPASPGRALKACLLTALESKSCPCDRRLSASMIAAGANDPKLLEPIRELHRHRLARLNEAAGPSDPAFERAALIFLATDGLRLTEMLQVSPFDAQQRQRIVASILQLIDQETTPSCHGQAAV